MKILYIVLGVVIFSCIDGIQAASVLQKKPQFVDVASECNRYCERVQKETAWGGLARKYFIEFYTKRDSLFAEAGKSSEEVQKALLALSYAQEYTCSSDQSEGARLATGAVERYLTGHMGLDASLLHVRVDYKVPHSMIQWGNVLCFNEYAFFNGKNMKPFEWTRCIYDMSYTAAQWLTCSQVLNNLSFRKKEHRIQLQSFYRQWALTLAAFNSLETARAMRDACLDRSKAVIKREESGARGRYWVNAECYSTKKEANLAEDELRAECELYRQQALYLTELLEKMEACVLQKQPSSMQACVLPLPNSVQCQTVGAPFQHSVSLHIAKAYNDFLICMQRLIQASFDLWKLYEAQSESRQRKLIADE